MHWKPWTFVLISILSFSRSLMAETPCPTAGSRCLSLTPLDDSLEFLTQALNAATQTIQISIYSLTEKTTVENIIARADQGVSVEILADFNNSYETGSLFGRLAALHHPHIQLLRASHFRGLNPQSHNKFILIDGKTVIMGSANLSDFGLNGAFDLFLKLDDPAIVQKFQAEFQELKAHATILCRQLSRAPELCGTGQELYPKTYYKLIRTGSLDQTLVKTEDASCERLWRENHLSLLNRYNQVPPSARRCVQDERLLQTLDLIAANESFSTGESVQAYCTAQGKINCEAYGRVQPWDDAGDRVYFSPEDNPEDQIAQQLRLLDGKDPTDYAIFSLTLLSNRFLIKEMTQLVERGVPVYVLLDANSNRDPSTDHADTLFQTLQDQGHLFSLPNIYGSTEVISLHHRFAVLRHGGQEQLMVGSPNWSAAGFQYSDEALYFTKNQILINLFKDHYINLLGLAAVDLQQHPLLQTLQNELSPDSRRQATTLIVFTAVPEAVTFAYEPNLYTQDGRWLRRITPLTSRQWVVVQKAEDGPVEVGLTDRDQQTLQKFYPLTLGPTTLSLRTLTFNYLDWAQEP